MALLLPVYLVAVAIGRPITLRCRFGSVIPNVSTAFAMAASASVALTVPKSVSRTLTADHINNPLRFG
jgi:hypothetical protein